MLLNIVFGVLVVLAAIVFNWQKDKSSFAIAAKQYWLLYAIVFGVTVFLTGWLLDSSFGHRIFQLAIGGAIVFFWNFIKGLFAPVKNSDNPNPIK